MNTIKYIFSTFLLLQLVSIRAQVIHFDTLTYLIDNQYFISSLQTNDKDNLSVGLGLNMERRPIQRKINPKLHSFQVMNRQRREFKKKYSSIFDDIWLGQLEMSTKKSNSLFREEIYGDTILKCKIDEIQASNEIAIYSVRYHYQIFTLFHIKHNTKDSAFSKLYYGVFFNYIFSLKSVTYLYDNLDYPLFTYAVYPKLTYQNIFSIQNTKPYLLLGFCPKIGIVSYHYLTNNTHITLMSINGKSILYFIQNNKCITPFCNIGS